MYDINHIKALLDKYWKGNTDREEETLLREYFSQSVDVADELQYAVPYFEAIRTPLHYDISHSHVMTEDFDKAVLSKIQAATPPVHPETRAFLFQRITGIAAALLLVSGLAFYLFPHTFKGRPENIAAINNLPLQPLNPAPRIGIAQNEIATAKLAQVRKSPKAVAIRKAYPALPAEKQETGPVNLTASTAPDANVPDTYTDPEEAQKYLDSVLNVVSQKYSQGMALAMKQSYGLEILKHPLSILNKKE